MTDPDPTPASPQDWSDLLKDAGPSNLARALLAPEPVPKPDD